MGSTNTDEWEVDYKKLLNKKDPLDKQILNLAKHGDLKVSVVEVKQPNEHASDNYSQSLIPHQGKHTS